MEGVHPHIYGIQNQLDRLETVGVLVSRKVGRARVSTYSPRYAFLDGVQALLEKTLSFYPEELRDIRLLNRRRPRLRGKPL